MSNRTLYIFAAIILLCIGTLFLVKFLPMIKTVTIEKRLPPNQVKGMEFIHLKTPWTLNFEQQTKAINLLNRAIAISKDSFRASTEPRDVDTLIIYRFTGKDLNLTVIGENNQNLVFLAPEWNPSGYIEDISGGELKSLLNNTYDP